MDDSRPYTVSVNPFVAFSSGHGNWNIKSASLICTVAHTLTKTNTYSEPLKPYLSYVMCFYCAHHFHKF